MPDIIVTTPKSEIANAAAEFESCKRDGGGTYFRTLASKPNIFPGERVFYVEDGFIRGFAVVEDITQGAGIDNQCDTTGRIWRGKCVIWMDAKSWKWIQPIPMNGFQGWRYNKLESFMIAGSWLDPKPEVS